MLLFEKISNIKNIYHKIILILSFIISWFSIGTHYTNLLIFTPNEGTSIIEIINFIRVALSLLCFPILCIMFFINMSKYKENNINPKMLTIIIVINRYVFFCFNFHNKFLIALFCFHPISI